MTNQPLVSVVIPTCNRERKLTRLVSSILNSNYPKNRLEIIVIDDNSTDATYRDIEKYPNITIVRNNKKLFPSKLRNIGIRKATGKYILFIDDDNVVEKDMILNLVCFMENHKSVGIVAPLMLYYGSNLIWCAGIKRNMLTSLTSFLLNGKDYTKVKLPKIIESDDFPNCFMTRRDIILKYGIYFDEILFPIHYEESDFCRKVHSKGYKIVMFSNAKVWHDVGLPGKPHNIFDNQSPQRLFYTARNRILFHKKYTPWYKYILFLFLFLPLLTFYYLYKGIVSNTENKILKITSFLNGVWKGIFMSV